MIEFEVLCCKALFDPDDLTRYVCYSARALYKPPASRATAGSGDGRAHRQKLIGNETWRARSRPGSSSDPLFDIADFWTDTVDEHVYRDFLDACTTASRCATVRCFMNSVILRIQSCRIAKMAWARPAASGVHYVRRVRDSSPAKTVRSLPGLAPRPRVRAAKMAQMLTPTRSTCWTHSTVWAEPEREIFGPAKRYRCYT